MNELLPDAGASSALQERHEAQQRRISALERQEQKAQRELAERLSVLKDTNTRHEESARRHAQAVQNERRRREGLEGELRSLRQQHEQLGERMLAQHDSKAEVLGRTHALVQASGLALVDTCPKGRARRLSCVARACAPSLLKVAPPPARGFHLAARPHC